ncbi:MAG: leucyl aminopeptidase [Saprospiraceae bacterium]
MSFSINLVSSSTAVQQVTVSAVYEGNGAGQLGTYTAQTASAKKGKLAESIKTQSISGKLGNVDITQDGQHVLIGLGKADELNAAKFKGAIKTVLNKLNERDITEFAIGISDFATKGNFEESDFCQLLAQALHEGLYQYSETKSAPKAPIKLDRVSVVASSKNSEATLERSLKIGQALGEGETLCKQLSDLPGNVCTPTYLAKQAEKLGKQYEIDTTILDEAKMKKLKMGSLLSVSRGSREPAKLIVMEYMAGKKDDKPIVLVGKGLTFDAGGISIKPSAAMDEMKYDMCGGATVFGVMRALGELKVPVNVVGVVPSSENLPDGDANKPGDIVTSMQGTTIEILNTDAEGRLILCDALTYSAKFDPEVVVDIATLTGACTVALGQHASGLFSNDDALADQLLAAGERASDRAWRLPIWDEYQQQLKSNFADVANIGGRFAGAVTAACFLERFCKDYRWAHLDIAGTAWKSGGAKGATGRPVAMLLDFVLNYKP